MSGSVSPPRLWVGLGNPKGYEGTRHNIGSDFLRAWVLDVGLSWSRARDLSSHLCAVSRTLWACIPDTYMNLSGQAVGAVARYYKIEAPSIWVWHDDLDIPVGAIRFKKGGGHGGHNGLRDIARALGTQDFVRVRIGIGHPGVGRDVSAYVLSKFPSSEREAVWACQEALHRSESFLMAGDLEALMRVFHGAHG